MSATISKHWKKTLITVPKHFKSSSDINSSREKLSFTPTTPKKSPIEFMPIEWETVMNRQEMVGGFMVAVAFS
jgi:hypothetical protein